MNNIVLIESPYRNGDRNRNLRYLAWCEYHAASLGEVPIASHGNCTAYWPEDEEHRTKGFAWRDALRGTCRYVVQYIDLGTSEGQLLAETRDKAANVGWIRRSLPLELRAKFDNGEYPPGSMRRVDAAYSDRFPFEYRSTIADRELKHLVRGTWLEAVRYASGDLCGYSFYCPGCERSHVFYTTGTLSWNFDGNMESPTFSPSLRNQCETHPNPKLRMCHLNLTAGKLHFHPDSTHDLSGKVVDLGTTVE